VLIIDGKWDRETEVVIVGYGAAGAAAALTVHERGVKALVLEKQEEGKHFSTSHMSAGGFLNFSDRNEARRYLRAMSRLETSHLYSPSVGWPEDAPLDAYVESALFNKAWVEGLGGTVKETARRPENDFPGADCFSVCRFPDAGIGMMRVFEGAVKGRGIEVMFSTSALKLLTNVKSEVLGVQAATGEDPVQKINIRAARGVILTLGGFEFDEEMKFNFLKVYPSVFAGSEASTGDGVRMTLDVGAQLWHMNSVSGRYVAKVPEIPVGISMSMGRSRIDQPCGFIMVDKYGRRFTREEFSNHGLYYEAALFDCQTLDYPRVPSYLIFDHKRLSAGPVPVLSSGITGPMQGYVWSQDNSVELERGWIVAGDTARELAAALGMDSHALGKTISTYNGYCARGRDSDYGREADDLTPIDAPLFYAIPMWPGGMNTQGGAKRNEKAQVLNVDGEPIPGLYSAGEFGSIFGMLYAGGGNISECLAFGRIAGENAASRKT
jgi:succinate dehydrogenase/fumarate reductase flavoprotein subunit